MNAKSGRICLLLALLSLSLAAALSIGLNARHSGVTVQTTMNAHVAMMQLQGSSEASPELDEGTVAPESEADAGDKTALCAQHDPHCPSLKQKLALALSEDRQPHESRADESRAQESKTFAAPSDEIPSKSRD